MAAVLTRASLDDYIKRALAQPPGWGGAEAGHDCCSYAGDWIREATGQDPFGAFRGQYDSALQAGRIAAQAGGLKPLIARVMTEYGFPLVDGPEHGDIGVIDLPDCPGRVAGVSVVICSGAWWTARTEQGVAWFQSPAAMIWRIL